MTDRVMKVFACPECEERRVDELPFLEEDHVQCASCGTEYNPLTREVILAKEKEAARVSSNLAAGVFVHITDKGHIPMSLIKQKGE